MPDLTIPERHASGFARIIGLSADESQLVRGALAQARSLNIKELTQLVETALPSLKSDGAREIVGTLLSLYSARTGTDLTVDQLVSDLMEAMPRAANEPINRDNPQPLEVVRETFRNLLSVRPLSMIAKAWNLRTDHENIFYDARVLTDLRAVFDVDVKESPAGFAMAHILKLSYRHAGQHTELHVAMDKVDVERLLLALQRAKVKAATLSAISTGSGFSILAD